MPVALLAHERVELPEPPITMFEERVQTRLVEFVATFRATFPAKPFCGMTVIVAVPATLALTVTVVALVLIE
jgi:hypothetical protein